MYYWKTYKKDYRNNFAVIKSKVNDQNQVVFDSVDIPNVDIKEKNIVILCGNDSKSKSRAEYYARLCRNWLQYSPMNSQIATYSIFYPNEQPLFNENSGIELDYEGLARELFHKIIFENRQPLSVETIMYNLKNVVFFGHSAGGYVMNELMKEFVKMLKEINYPLKDIRRICERIVFVGYSPYKLITSAPIKSVYVAPLYDSMGSTKMVYRLMRRRKDNLSSLHEYDIFGEDRINTRIRKGFTVEYRSKMAGEQAVYFANERSVIFTPDLLYNDGKNEDHNFAGAVNYAVKNPYQTEAGKLTARFLSETLDYCVSTERESFDLLDIYRQAQNLTTNNTIKI